MELGYTFLGQRMGWPEAVWGASSLRLGLKDPATCMVVPATHLDGVLKGRDVQSYLPTILPHGPSVFLPASPQVFLLSPAHFKGMIGGQVCKELHVLR
jgi:hypothetical protein